MVVITVVQTATSSPFGGNVTAGNMVLLIGYTQAGGPNSFTITNPKLGGTNPGNGTQVLFAQVTGGGNAAGVAIWLLPNVTGGTASYSLDQTGGSFNGIQAYEISGLGASPSADQLITNQGSITAITTGTTQPTTAAPEIAVAVSSVYSGSATNPAAWTTSHGSNETWMGYQIALTSGATYSWAQTTVAEPWAAGIVTIKAASAGGAKVHNASAAAALIAVELI
jgi:hypothetical protein